MTMMDEAVPPAQPLVAERPSDRASSRGAFRDGLKGNRVGVESFREIRELRCLREDRILIAFSGMGKPQGFIVRPPLLTTNKVLGTKVFSTF